MFIEERVWNEINEIDENKKNEIKKSLMENGFIGTPIFYTETILLTGSHRIAALKELEDVEFEAIDLTKEVNEWLEENDKDYNDIDYDDLNDMDEKEIRNYFELTK